MISRNLATPLAAIGLILMATTGLGMFFELATEPTKTLHEWGGWLFVAGAALHVSSNLESFKRHVAKPLVAGLLVLTFAIAMTSFFIEIVRNTTSMATTTGIRPWVNRVSRVSWVKKQSNSERQFDPNHGLGITC